MKRKMTSDKKVIQKIDKLADKALGEKEQLKDAKMIMAKRKKK
jgi:hypothetical protein